MPDGHRVLQEPAPRSRYLFAAGSNADGATGRQRPARPAIAPAIYNPSPGGYRTGGRAPAGSPLPALQAAQTLVADPQPTPRAMAWLASESPNPCTIQCVGHV